MKKSIIEFMALGGIVGTTVLSGVILTRPRTAAVSYSDQATVTVSAACSFKSGGGEYTENITSGQTKTITANTVETTCNDHAGYAVYAIGFSDDSYNGTYHTDMRANAGDIYNIKTDGSAGGGSYWKMKMTNASNATIAGSFASYQQIPSTFTKVISYSGVTNSGSFTPQYEVYAGASQIAAVYTGKVKYVLVHPNAMAPGTYSINYVANGGNGTMNSVTGLYNFEEQEVAANGFTAPSGYKFAGWCTTNTAGYYACDDIIFEAGSTLPASPTPAATANGTLNLYAIWQDIVPQSSCPTSPMISYVATGITYMQDINSSNSASVLSSLTTGSTYQIKDNRDDETYCVSKLADGKLWMLDNLALDLTNDTILNSLSASNTNIDTANDPGALAALKGTNVRDPNTDSAGKYATAKVLDNWNGSHSYSAPLVNLTYKETVPSDATSQAGGYKIGGYYNYCAASAGSYCYGNGTSEGTSSGNATSSICPKGWRMPTGSTSGEYSALANIIYGSTSSTSDPTSYANYRSTLRLPLSGYFNDGSASTQGSYGVWWSSTRLNNYYMYSLYANTSDIYPANNSNRSDGFSVRCALGS